MHPQAGINLQLRGKRHKLRKRRGLVRDQGVRVIPQRPSKCRPRRWRDGVKEESGRGQSSRDEVETDALISRLRNARSPTCVHVCLMALIS